MTDSPSGRLSRRSRISATTSGLGLPKRCKPRGNRLAKADGISQPPAEPAARVIAEILFARRVIGIDPRRAAAAIARRKCLHVVEFDDPDDRAEDEPRGQLAPVVSEIAGVDAQSAGENLFAGDARFRRGQRFGRVNGE